MSALSSSRTIPRVLIVERGWRYDITGKRANRFSVVQITLVAVAREMFSIQNRVGTGRFWDEKGTKKGRKRGQRKRRDKPAWDWE
jgi:hypothetical protein